MGVALCVSEQVGYLGEESELDLAHAWLGAKCITVACLFCSQASTSGLSVVLEW